GRLRLALRRHDIPHAAPAHEQALDGLLVLAEVAGIAKAHRESIASFHGLGNDPAAQGYFDGVLDVADADAVAGGFLPIDVNLQIALAHDRLGDHVLGALDRLDGLLDLLANAVDGFQVGAEDLDADLRAHAGRKHVDAVGNRLRPDVAPAGHL